MDLSQKIISLPIETQYFPFLQTFMKYILQNSSPKLLLKLYQCCKYFYFKSKITIAPIVWFDLKEKEIEHEFFVSDGKDFFCDYANIEKLWLCEKLQIYSFSNTKLIGNAFFNKICRNNLKELYIETIFTSFKELEILSKSPNLIDVNLHTNIKNENGEPIPIEEIMGLFPNMKKFEICLPHFTMESFQKLSKFKFLNKFKVLEFSLVESEFEPISMCKFLQDNLYENSEFYLNFCSSQLENQLLPRVKEIIDGWETKKPKHLYLGF